MYDDFAPQTRDSINLLRVGNTIFCENLTLEEGLLDKISRIVYMLIV